MPQPQSQPQSAIRLSVAIKCKNVPIWSILRIITFVGGTFVFVAIRVGFTVHWTQFLLRAMRTLPSSKQRAHQPIRRDPTVRAIIFFDYWYGRGSYFSREKEREREREICLKLPTLFFGRVGSTPERCAVVCWRDATMARGANAHLIKHSDSRMLPGGFFFFTVRKKQCWQRGYTEH